MNVKVIIELKSKEDVKNLVDILHFYNHSKLVDNFDIDNLVDKLLTKLNQFRFRD